MASVGFPVDGSNTCLSGGHSRHSDHLGVHTDCRLRSVGRDRVKALLGLHHGPAGCRRLWLPPRLDMLAHLQRRANTWPLSGASGRDKNAAIMLLEPFDDPQGDAILVDAKDTTWPS